MTVVYGLQRKLGTGCDVGITLEMDQSMFLDVQSLVTLLNGSYAEFWWAQQENLEFWSTVMNVLMESGYEKEEKEL